MLINRALTDGLHSLTLNQQGGKVKDFNKVASRCTAGVVSSRAETVNHYSSNAVDQMDIDANHNGGCCKSTDGLQSVIAKVVCKSLGIPGQTAFY